MPAGEGGGGGNSTSNNNIHLTQQSKRHKETNAEQPTQVGGEVRCSIYIDKTTLETQ
jgi:hypothetical protein